jgi:hypothetical protein
LAASTSAWASVRAAVALPVQDDLEGAGAELGHGPAAAHHVGTALLDPGQHGASTSQQPLVGAVPVHDQVPGKRAQPGDHRVVAAGNQADQPDEALVRGADDHHMRGPRHGLTGLRVSGGGHYLHR